MIVPMKKITLVVLEPERQKALASLRSLGVLHVEQRESTSVRLSDLQSKLSLIDQALLVLSEADKKKRNSDKTKAGTDIAWASVDRVLSARDEKKVALENIVRLDREIERLASWGDIDPADFRFLSGKGITLIPFDITAEDFSTLDEQLRFIVIERTKKNVRCAFLLEDGETLRNVPRGMRELALPSMSTSALRAERDACALLVPELDARLKDETKYVHAIENLHSEVMKEIQFERIHSGMPVVNIGTESSAQIHAVAWLTGFIPCDDCATLESAAREHGWAYISDDPSDDDIVPTKIRNNRFVNLISPLLDFLGTVPGYREMDISLWFLLFFGIFFAMIFGDAGYGTLMVLLSVGGIVSAAKKSMKAETGLYMLLYLGVMTVAWGTITCTWFGIPPESLPDFLNQAAIPSFKNGNAGSDKNIQVFCFALGLLQLSIAHLIGIVRNIKTLKFLGELGSLLMLVGMFFVVLNLVVDATRYPLPSWAVYTILTGFILNFVFINYSGKIGGGILESLKNIITMLLGVVNVFGDIMSYIRLWAVGLAGAAISGTVNAMAGPMFGGLILFAGVVLLVFGHGLNFILNVLSVIVHGVRLNTLEFSNHLGLTWSGFKYEPFSETAKK